MLDVERLRERGEYVVVIGPHFTIGIYFDGRSLPSDYLVLDTIILLLWVLFNYKLVSRLSNSLFQAKFLEIY